MNAYVEEMRDKGLLTGYFGMLAKNLYGRTRVKNSEILELLIYGAYIEEQSKLEEQELNIFKDVVSFYYEQGQEEVNRTFERKKEVSGIPDTIFLGLLDTPNSKGYVWKQYVEAIIKYNANQIYRQCIIHIQQDKENDIDDSIFQNIMKKQQNAKLCINGDKISGDVDLTLIGLNNQAKLQGIYSFDENAKCKFITIEDEVTTKECHSLNGQEFFVHDWNEFYRYSKTNDSIVRYRCYGLVTGLNLPPINDGFHWCRSYIIYLPAVEKVKEVEYNKLELPSGKNNLRTLINKSKLNQKTRKLIDKYLTKENVIIDENNKSPMHYDIDKDKIIVNPKHKDLKDYDLGECLTHEIIHMIDIRNNISSTFNIDNELRRTELFINTNKDFYKKLFEDDKYAKNMTLSDIFSAITNNKVTGKIGHGSKYWNEDSTRIQKEISANIMSAYLNNNKITLNIIDNIEPLKQIKERIVKKYDKYT